MDWSPSYAREDQAGSTPAYELIIFYAQVMELVDIPDLESGALRREGSSPSLSTIGI